MSRYLQFDDAKEILEARAPIVPTGDGWFKTLCPAHDDTRPSLTFGPGRRDGNFVPDCKANCSTREIVVAIRRLAGDTVPADKRARRLTDYLKTKPERTDAELADLFKVTPRTIGRWVKGFREDGLAWVRKSHGKLYDITDWAVRDRTSLKGSDTTKSSSSDQTSRAELDSDATQSKRTLPVEGGNDVGAKPSPPLPAGDVSSANSAKNVVSHVIDYPYNDPVTGGLIAFKRRHIETKEFEWFHRVMGKADIRKGLGRFKEKHLPLYNAHKLGRTDLDTHVFLVEGEKAANALNDLGFVAVCFAGGAHAKDFNYVTWADLINRRVLYWPDNDKPGEALMYEIGHKIDENLLQHSWVRVEELGLPAGGDAYDFIEARGQGDDEFRSAASAAVEDLIPARNDETPKSSRLHCRECDVNYFKHVGRLCPNPKCINNPAYKGKRRRSRP